MTQTARIRNLSHKSATDPTPIFSRWGVGDTQATPIVAQENLGSWKHLRSTVPPDVLGGKRPRTQRFPSSINTRAINATSRMAHAQRRCSRAGFSTSGNTMPPTLLPTNVMPEAKPRRASNQCATTASAVVVRKAELVPHMMP